MTYSSYFSDEPLLLTQRLNSVEFLQQTLQPTLPLIADNCHLPITAVQQVLPLVARGVTYQLLLTIQNPKSDEYSHSSANYPLFFDELFAPIPTELLAMSQGLDLKVIHQLQPYVNEIMQGVFDDTSRFYALMGVLMAKTSLDLAQLVAVTQWGTTLSVLALHKLYQSLPQLPLPTVPALSAWLGLQPPLLADMEHQAIATALGYQSPMGLRALVAQRQDWAKQQILPLFTGYDETKQRALLQAFSQALQAFVASQPMAIVPRQLRQLAKSSKPTPATPQTKSMMTQDIFQPVAKPSHTWIDILQRYWIATAILLSTIVLGGIGLLVKNNSPTKTPTQTANDATQSPIYQDVAIVRVASTASVIEPTASTAKHQATASVSAMPSSKPKQKTVEKVAEKSASKPVSKPTTTTKPLVKTAKTEDAKKPKEVKVKDVKAKDVKAKEVQLKKADDKTTAKKAPKPTDNPVKNKATSPTKKTDKPSHKQTNKTSDKDHSSTNDSPKK
ncbi:MULTISPECIES: hypothetical protein [unclassified Moraxella]|uniref:hypothetical protein n=1 Tax=unclassified Moraxella TaxID=2685852 RepID=UPI003AF4CA93